MSRQLSKKVIDARINRLLDALNYTKDGCERHRPLRVVGLGAGAWGAVFMAMLQEMYAPAPELVDITVWRRGGRFVDKDDVKQLIEVINQNEPVLRRLRSTSVYLKYVSARLGDRKLTACDMLRDGFCLNLPNCPLCPLKVRLCIIQMASAFMSASKHISFLFFL